MLSDVNISKTPRASPVYSRHPSFGHRAATCHTGLAPTQDIFHAEYALPMKPPIYIVTGQPEGSVSLWGAARPVAAGPS